MFCFLSFSSGLSFTRSVRLGFSIQLELGILFVLEIFCIHWEHLFSWLCRSLSSLYCAELFHQFGSCFHTFYSVILSNTIQFLSMVSVIPRFPFLVGSVIIACVE